MNRSNEQPPVTNTPSGGQAPERAKILAVFPQLWVKDVRITAEWYRDFLGFEIGEYFLDPPVFVHVWRNHVVFQIGLAREPEALTRPARGLGCNAYVWTDHVDDLSLEFRSKGVRIVEDPVDRKYACREMMIEDCNGLRFCFAQRI